MYVTFSECQGPEISTLGRIKLILSFSSTPLQNIDVGDGQAEFIYTHFRGGGGC